MSIMCSNCFQKTVNEYGICTACGYDGAKNKQDFPLALPAGSILYGRYIVGKVLGQGGFGITYLAQDYQTKEFVAIKEFFPGAMATRTGTTVMPYSGVQGENFTYGKNSFLDEAKTMAEFNGNPNIAGVQLYFEENGTAYFVMEYLDGYSFGDYIVSKGGKLPWVDVAGVMLPVLEVLGQIHAKGVVHRDVAPDNIFITKDGTVKLLDFGAARHSLGNVSQSLDVVIKHGFAPKEQYSRRGRQGPYTDVYAASATIYYALTGAKPDESIDRAENDTMPPPTVLGAKISQVLEDALMKGLSVDAKDRYQSATELRDALTKGIDVSTGSDAKKSKETDARKSHLVPKWLIPVGATAILLLGLIIGFGVSGRDNSKEQMQLPTQNIESAAATTPADLTQSQITSPNVESAAATEAADSDIVESGTCGENVNWQLSKDGVLTISGYGDMYDYGSEYRQTVNGITGSKSGSFGASNGNAPWYEQQANIYSVIIENGVTSIGRCAFSGSVFGGDYSRLEQVIIPDSVTSIGQSAFAYCTALRQIVLPNGITVIPYAAFMGCEKLATVNIPDSVTSISVLAFHSCYSLTQIALPDGISYIGEAAFQNCVSLEHVTVSNSEIRSSNTASDERLGSTQAAQQLSSTGNETNISVVSLAIQTYEVPDIDNYAFNQCTSLQSVIIPGGISIIGTGAFQDCSSLTQVVFHSGVSKIGREAFKGCALTNVIISKDCKYEDSAFDKGVQISFY